MTAGAARGAFRLGALLAIATLALDQLGKLYMLKVLDLAQTRETIELTAFLDLSFVPNRGISFGLFPQDSPAGKWFMVALALAAVIVIGLWMARTSSRLIAAALGLIAGGASGNALDRVRFGAVVDFLHLHGGKIWWLDFPYRFNVADAAISIGVVLLLAESLLTRKAPLKQDGKTA